jgi:hypothetical protein
VAVPWIDLADVKAHLNKTTTTDDAELEGFIDAACAMVEDIVGHVDTVTVSEVVRTKPVLTQQQTYWRYNVWQQIATLAQAPVLDVTSVTYEVGDGTSSVVAKQDPVAGVVSGWRLVDQVLFLPLATNVNGAYLVAYRAGRSPVPGNYRMAALELVAHLWKTTQAAAGSPGRPGEPDTDWQRGMGYAMPFRVRELLGLYGNTVPSRGFVIA